MGTWTRLPIRLRLTAIFALGMATVLAGLGGFLYTRLGAELLRGTDVELRSRAGVIVAAMSGRGPLRIDSGRVLRDPDEAFAQVLDPSGAIVDTTPGVRAAPMLPPSLLRSVSGPTFLTRRVAGVDDASRLLAVPATRRRRQVVVVVGATLGDRGDALARLLLLLVIGGPVALALSSLAGWAVAGRALREALLREHRFVDQASHELRTPLAILKAELDLALARPRSHAELEATVRSASVETDQLVQLAEDLLVLARSNGGRLPLWRAPVSLRALLAGTAAPSSSARGRSARGSR